MTSLVWADTTYTLGVLEVFDMLLDRTAGNAKRLYHPRKGQLRITRQEIENAITAPSGNLTVKLLYGATVVTFRVKPVLCVFCDFGNCTISFTSGAAASIRASSFSHSSPSF